MSAPLSPLRVRLAAFAALVLIALGSIGLIDRRAMQRQAELEAAAVEPASPVERSRDQPRPDHGTVISP